MAVASASSRRSAATPRRAANVDRDLRLVEVQRARIVAATIDAIAELGYGGLTVSEVIARARISRRTFYEHFADREECFLAAMDLALARVAEPVLAGYRAHGAWRERIAAALSAALELFDEEPELARLLVVDALSAGPPTLERRAAVLDGLVRAVDAGRATARGREPGPLAAEAVVGAVLGVLHARLLAADPHESLSALAGPLMNAIVLPYLGPAAAARELRRATPPTRSAGQAPRAKRSNPLHGLDMRLTYRTLRVLAAVGELAREGSSPSNRDIAAAAGIADQGQMSKLLARLQRLGLIENRKPARAHGRPFNGEPNRWELTARGAEIVQTIRDRPVAIQARAPARQARAPAARRAARRH
jgi:AcrR family transcriptional regulator